MHSPFRSESDVFRGAVAVVLGTAIAVLIGALTDAQIGAIVAAVLIGIAIGAVMRAGRGTLPEVVERPTISDDTHRILVVANQTVAGRELREALAERASKHGRCDLLVVCPALTSSRLQLLASDTDAARAEAQERLQHSLEALHTLGLEATGRVGDEDPVVAAADALRSFAADEVLVSTHPPEHSRWLERGVVDKLRAVLDLPVSHVVVTGAHPEAAKAS